MTDEMIKKLFESDINSLSDEELSNTLNDLSDQSQLSELSIEGLDLSDGLYFNLLFEKKRREKI